MKGKCAARFALTLALFTTLHAPAHPARAQGSAVYLPGVMNGRRAQGACPDVSAANYGLIDIDGGYYKDNRLTDENADLRLSVLGSVPVNAPLTFVTYNGPADPGAPRFDGVFEPNRIPAFVSAAQRRDWNWNENGPPPYGAPGGANNDWPVTVLGFGATAGEGVYPPERGAQIGGGFNAMVLYAGEEEITLAYYRQDGVASGYVVFLTGLCVDPSLVALYRAQLSNGRRASGKLPGVSNNQRIGVAKGAEVRIAVRDRGTFLDPRSRRDWWP